MTLEEFKAEASDLNGALTESYLEAVYRWAEDYALAMDDAWSILRNAAECYRGTFHNRAAYAEHVAEGDFKERLDAIDRAANKEPMFQIEHKWDMFAIVLESTPGYNFSAYGHHYFTEPRQAMVNYRLQHHAPNGDDESHAPLWDMERVMPDLYTRPRLYSDTGGMPDREAWQTVLAARGLPDRLVTIYRAVPEGVTAIHSGDWVSTSLEYARLHAMQDDEPTHDWPVIVALVPAGQLFSEGNSLQEYGYSGPDILQEPARYTFTIRKVTA